MARCPSPDTLWCAVPRTPPRPSSTVVVTVRLCGSEPTTLPASASVTSTLERATPRLAIFRSPPWLTTVGGPADNVPVEASSPTLLKGQAGPEGTDRGRQFRNWTPHHGGLDSQWVRPRPGLRP